MSDNHVGFCLPSTPPRPIEGWATYIDYSPMFFHPLPEKSDERWARFDDDPVPPVRTGDEDFRTVLDINRSLPAFAGESFLFGRNEKGNQNLHRWVARLTA